MIERTKKHLVIPSILFVIMIFTVVGSLTKILSEEVAFLILAIVAFSMSGIYFRSVWKWKKELPSIREIGKNCFYLSFLAVTVSLILLILSFFGVHLIVQTPK